MVWRKGPCLIGGQSFVSTSQTEGRCGQAGVSQSGLEFEGIYLSLYPIFLWLESAESSHPEHPGRSGPQALGHLP